MTPVATVNKLPAKKNKVSELETNTSNIITIGNTNKKTIQAQAKLMSIASGLKKNILPKTHLEINEIYKRRLNKYLNFISLYGENN